MLSFDRKTISTDAPMLSIMVLNIGVTKWFKLDSGSMSIVTSKGNSARRTNVMHRLKEEETGAEGLLCR